MEENDTPARLLKALAELPFDVQQSILRKAGLHTRLVCRTFRLVHGAPLQLAPHGLTTSQQVEAAACSFPHDLISLDLRALPGTAVPDPTLAAVCSHLPNLRQLLLPERDFRVTPGGVVAAIHHLPHLTHLYFPSYLPNRAPTPHDSALTVASRLRAVTLPATRITTPSSYLTALSALSFQEHTPQARCTVDAAHLVAWATPRLASLEVHAFGFGATLVNAPELARLTSLTALALAGLEAAPGTTLGRTLHSIGSLTALRRLNLRFLRSGFTPDERGWLSRLSALTHLHVSFYCCADGAAGHFAAAAPGGRSPCEAIWTAVTDAVQHHLPRLQELILARNAFSSHGSAALLGPGLQHIAAAPQLRRLRLRGFDLPAEEAAILGQRLQQLTCLQLAHCRTVRPPAPPAAAPAGAAAGAALGLGLGLAVARGGLALDWGALDWVTQLQQLRMLGCEGDGLTPCMRPPPVALVAALPRLTSLTVRGLGAQADYVRGLLEAAPQLEQLDLGMNPSIGPALASLTALTALRVLDLSLAAGGSRDLIDLPDLARLKAPRSLQRCYVLGAEDWQLSAAVWAANAHVDFRNCQRTDAAEW